MKKRSSSLALWILLLLAACPLTGAAQPSEPGNWWIYFGNLRLGERWNLWHELQYRNYNFAGDLEQLLIRGGMGYNLTPGNNNLLMGYAYVQSRPYLQGGDARTTTREHRLYQQFITRQQLGKVSLQHRYRMEERFLKGDLSWRARYFLGLNLPLNRPGMEQKAFYLSLYQELFVNLAAPLFDRSRLYGAIGYVMSPAIRVEAGIMRQFLENGARTQAQIVIFNTLDARRSDED